MLLVGLWTLLLLIVLVRRPYVRLAIVQQEKIF